jgi:signal transduction histidine kinase
LFWNEAEFNFRANTVQQAQQRLSLQNALQQADSPRMAAPPQAAATEAVFRAFWLGDALVLARRVNPGPDFVIQGCWLDWTSLRRLLLDSIRDLFPNAKLEPLTRPLDEPNARRLATLPVELLTGSPAPGAPAAWTPLRLALLVAWTCVLIAVVAVGFLLRGTLNLSERRAAFVSSVTHELRTPLTTFRLYSEMLSEGMVSDDTARKAYLATLCAEANRLTHLVENVLAYARLERTTASQRQERIALGDLIERVKPRLIERTGQAGLTLVEEAGERARSAVVRVDIAAVEQILFNLVDNACKYAAPTATRRILHLEARPHHRKFIGLRVRDHGPGLTAEAIRRLFQPFAKSAQAAAETASGVGLGLALSRRLSRGLGGDLRLDRDVEQGAAFLLLLPLAAR